MTCINLREYEELDEATKMYGDKSKRFYQLNIPATAALVRARSMRDQRSDRIPSLAWKKV